MHTERYKEWRDSAVVGIRKIQSDFPTMLSCLGLGIAQPSTVMTVAEDRSANVNAEACAELEQWFLSEDAQKLIMQGFMHSVFADMKEIPWGSVSTEDLIQKDLGVDWENAYHNREALNKDWTEIVNR